MAYDYGSIDLGIPNPFRFEGAVRAIRGLIILALGIIMLVSAVSSLQTDQVAGRWLAVFAVVIMGSGLTTAGSGLLATLRFFVGRNHPTSLAENRDRSAGEAAEAEKGFVEYENDEVTEMLRARKNITFVEPRGLTARIVHSLVPRLTTMPYPIRNLAQRVFGAWVNTFVALLALAIVGFVVMSGLAGDLPSGVVSAYALGVLSYIAVIWYRAGKGINRRADRKVMVLGRKQLLGIVVGAIASPAIIAAIWTSLRSLAEEPDIDMTAATDMLPQISTTAYLIGWLFAAVIASILVFTLLRPRLRHADPRVEVSELRENWQESVHPNEIFINLDNLVMANRRFKEVPNRVYTDLDPTLDEEIAGKGQFKGEMTQEIQPRYKPVDLGAGFRQIRNISMLLGNILHVVSAILVTMACYGAAGAISEAMVENGPALGGLLSPVLNQLVLALLTHSFARILVNTAHLLFAELLFESNLIHLRMEGTFTESKISTGTSIHDSTRSENVLVRSSITPWIIVSRIVTSTFASSGLVNLEFPRYILEMHKNDEELRDIRSDIQEFLKDRESIAAITSTRDLRNASQIHDINQQTRAVLPNQQPQDRIADENAAGFMRQQEELPPDEPV
ncbi:MAG: hypothetical protein AAFV47_05740 [Pseudomonadota bacterium]